MKKEKREKDQFTAVLEDIRSDFSLFAESMSRVHEKLDNHETRLERVESKVDNLSDDVFVIKETIKVIRGDLKQKVDYEEFESLEKRVAKLENRTKSR